VLQDNLKWQMCGKERGWMPERNIKSLKGHIKEEEVIWEKEGEISDRLSEERKTIMNKLGGWVK